MIHIKAPKFISFFTKGNDVVAISIFCFLVYKDKLTPSIINHEEIHYKQCLECGIIGFWLLYFYYYIKIGYKNNPFEKEAYENDDNLDYLKKRKFWAWLKYRN